MEYCIREKLRSDDPTRRRSTDPSRSIELPRLTGDGIYTWTDDDIAAYRAVHPVGNKKRLAMELARYTALRREDLVRIGPDDIKDGILTIQPLKTERSTGVTLHIPIHPDLALVIAATTCAPGTTFLATEYGEQRTVKGFSKWFREACNVAVKAVGLNGKASVHGLRKAACCALAECGCEVAEIMAISGIATLAIVQLYIAKANAKRLAKSGMAKWAAAPSPR